MNRRKLTTAALVIAFTAACFPASASGADEPIQYQAAFSAGIQYGFLSDPIGTASPYAYPAGVGARLEYAFPFSFEHWEPFLAAAIRYHGAHSLETSYFEGTRFILPSIALGAQRAVASYEDGRAYYVAGSLGYVHYLREHAFLGSTYHEYRPALTFEAELRALGPGPLCAAIGLTLSLILDTRLYLVPGLVGSLAYRQEMRKNAP